jgi:leucyl/phenylalanyl-tRNA---protein transferase
MRPLRRGGRMRLPSQNRLTPTRMRSAPPLPWLEPGQPFPPVQHTWGPSAPIPGLLAAGGTLDVPTLVDAYRQGIFPWFSDDQPILWWNPDPRMVLRVSDFRLHPSLRKTIRAGLGSGRLVVCIDSAFDAVIQHCAHTPRKGQRGTWILPQMVAAYTALHQAGHAHSIETWWDGELVGGLYCVNLGRMVFGESMFSHRSNASKIALAALAAHCNAWNVSAIDCQQNTAHLAALGAREMPRQDFLQIVHRERLAPSPDWRWNPVHWNAWLNRSTATQAHNPA